MIARDKEYSSAGGEEDNIDTSDPIRFPIYKQLIFTLIVVVGFFILLESCLAVIGLSPASSLDDPYVGFSSYLPLFVEERGDNGDPYLVTANNKLLFFQHQRFPKSKPESTLRIFCLGGSTTYGRPYDDFTSFCGWLRKLLPKADPSRQWEVINAGGISYASYRVALLMQELTEYEPDLFIVYTGQNEFLEKRTYGRILATPGVLRQVGSALSQTRTYTALKWGVDLLGLKPDKSSPAVDILPGEVETILERSVGPESYHRDDEMRRQVLEHYRFNLNRMIELASSVGAKVILITPASNLRDCSPFKSENRSELGMVEGSRFRELLTQGKDLYESGNLNRALTVSSEALRIDNRHAHLQYLRGRILWGLGRFEEAGAAFTRARDEDVCPLRALTEMGEIVKTVAAKHGAPVVDFAALAAGASQHGIPGQDLFLDHVHPTIEGNRMLALGLLNELSAQKVVHPTGSWGKDSIEQVTREVESQLDEEAHGIALRNLARVLRWAGKHEEALQLAEKSIAMIPKDVDAYFVAGSNAARLGRIDEAIKYYTQTLNIDPNHVEAHNNLGRVLAIQGKSEEAIRHYWQALKVNPDFSEAHYNLGIELAAQKMFDESVDNYRAALRIRPNYPEAYFNLGSVYQSLGKLQEAINSYQSALKLRPEFVGARNNLGKAFSEMGKSEKAMQHYELALQLEPDNFEVLNNIGVELSSQKRYTEAIQHYNRAIQLEPSYSRAHFNLGFALQSQGNLSESERHYQHALKLDPEFAEAHNNLANLLLSQGKYDEAMGHYREALRLGPDFAETHNNIGNAHAELGETDQAIGEYQKALESDPSYVEAHYNLGRILTDQGQFKQAIPHYRRVLQIDEDHAEGHHWLAIALGSLKQFDEAIPHFQKAIELRPTWPDPLLGLSLIFVTHPDPEKRDARKATEAAERAAELTDYKNIPVLIRLSDVYAATGKLDKAIAIAQGALSLSNALESDDLTKRVRRQLELYKKANK